jgi:Tol biopolymer transport system component
MNKFYTKMNEIKVLCLISLLIFGCSPGIHSETGKQIGYINGTIQDSKTNKPVEGVTVKVEGQETKTDKSGYYAINDIPSGSKTMELSKDGYQSKKETINIATEVQTIGAFIDNLSPIDNGGIETTPRPVPTPFKNIVIPPVKPKEVFSIDKLKDKFVYMVGKGDYSLFVGGDSIPYYYQTNFYIMIMDFNGANKKKIGEIPLWANRPSLSPDRKQIAFYSRDIYIPNLYTVNSDGTSMQKLTDEISFNCPPTWSPDGKKIAYCAIPEDILPTDIYIHIINSDGSDKKIITKGKDVSWSPDGKKLAISDTPQYESSDGFSNDNVIIYTINADGSDKKALTNTSGYIDLDKIREENPGKEIVDYHEDSYTKVDRSPSWSPDGKKIAFHSTRDNNYEIYTMNIDGSNQIRLTNNKLEAEVNPVWSKDGSKILYWYGENGYDDYYPTAKVKSFIMNPDGTGKKPFPDFETDELIFAWFDH